LRSRGGDIRTAYDGLEAIRAAESFQPEFMLLDIGLPHVSGYDVCRRIREQPWGKGIVIAALTGWGQEEDRRKSREAGFNHHLVKPVDANTLFRILSENAG
jgi:CheY-like chemotaxis protein